MMVRVPLIGELLLFVHRREAWAIGHDAIFNLADRGNGSLVVWVVCVCVRV